LRKSLRVTILQMDAEQPVARPLENTRRISAAVHQVTRIKTQTQFSHRLEREKMLDLLRRFQVCPDMMMKRHPEVPASAARDDLPDGVFRRLPFAGGPRKPVGLGAAAGDG